MGFMKCDSRKKRLRSSSNSCKLTIRVGCLPLLRIKILRRSFTREIGDFHVGCLVEAD